MTAEQQTNRTNHRFRTWPWLVLAGSLLLYLITLNHWLTLQNLAAIAALSGWDWHPLSLEWRPATFAPLEYLLTFPLRWLPATWQPIGMNVFSAICASLSLMLLARSVRLLPHDRTREQRKREAGAFAMISAKSWWIPPVLAVLVLGLQLTFWEHAVSGAGEMLNLLVFAWLIRCLLEFRVSQSDGWFFAFALSYGLGIPNNWALIGFFPCFLIAVIWIKGITFFQWRFVAKMACCGLCGLALYLLLPAVAVATGQGEFWTVLRAHLGQQKYMLTAIPRWIPLLLSLPSLMAVFFAGIKWRSAKTNANAFGSLLTGLFLRLMHIAFWLVGIWMFFDYKFSPRVLLEPIPFLTFYYIAALSVGYFSGYLLVVFGKERSRSRHHRSAGSMLLRKSVAGLVWIALICAPAGLAWRNLPKIQASNSNALRNYANRMVQSLPTGNAVVLSDDPMQLYLLRAASKDSMKPGKILVETTSLPKREYLTQLIAKNAEVQKLALRVETLPPTLDPNSVVEFLYRLNRHVPIYYLHPSFGYFFECFYTKPSGLAYQLVPASKGTLDAPALDGQEIEKNEAFWNGVDSELASLPGLARRSTTSKLVAQRYSIALNYWGVELQKANRVLEAEQRFSQAIRVNTNNFVAQINLSYNKQLQSGNKQPIDSSALLTRARTEYRTFNALLMANGPADEPGLLLELGRSFAQGQNLRQGAALFQRRLQLLPGDFDAQLALAKTYVDLEQTDAALDLLNKLSVRTPAGKPELARIEALIWLKKKDSAKAEEVLQSCYKQDPQDPARVSSLVEFYRITGYAAQMAGQAETAKDRFTRAISYIDNCLKAPQTPTASSSGNPKLELLSTKAELQIQLANYDQATATLTTVLDQQPKNLDALLNRAIAQLRGKKYDNAKRDYQALEKALPNRLHSIYYGLGEIALAQNEKAEAIKQFKRYLKHAPQETPEYKQVTERVRQLEAGM